MIDAVLSVHTNPLTCGVAKFSAQLAERLGVPFGELGVLFTHHPLVSVKGSEMPAYARWPITGPYSLFLHDTHVQWVVVQKAHTVYAANSVIADWVRPVRPDVIAAFCPSTVQGNASRGAYRVLAFGMGHKLALQCFQDLKGILDRDHPDYTISLSTAIHEGSPWDATVRWTVQGMRQIFGDKLRVLGFLGDDALAKELQDCDAVAIFYNPALRENNTSAWAALDAGKYLYTNTDERSPSLADPRPTWDTLLALMGVGVSV